MCRHIYPHGYPLSRHVGAPPIPLSAGGVRAVQPDDRGVDPKGARSDLRIRGRTSDAGRRAEPRVLAATGCGDRGQSEPICKRQSLVAWKFAEIVITGIALAGFWLGTQGNRSGPWVVLSTVFLMGMHSAFFVPAKYGAMPEILSARQLSRGNGLLESLSFLAIILGTVFGGVLSSFYRGQENVIGLILVGLALAGAVASLLIRRMPAANPGRPFPRNLYGPLWENLRDHAGLAALHDLRLPGREDQSQPVHHARAERGTVRRCQDRIGVGDGRWSNQREIN